MPFRDDQLHAIGQRRSLERRERRIGERLRHRQLRAICGRTARRELRRKRMDLDHEWLTLDPLARRREHLLRRRRPEEIERMESLSPKTPAQFKEDEETRRFLQGDSIGAASAPPKKGHQG